MVKVEYWNTGILEYWDSDIYSITQPIQYKQTIIQYYTVLYCTI